VRLTRTEQEHDQMRSRVESVELTVFVVPLRVARTHSERRRNLPQTSISTYAFQLEFNAFARLPRGAFESATKLLFRKEPPRNSITNGSIDLLPLRAASRGVHNRTSRRRKHDSINCHLFMGFDRHRSGMQNHITARRNIPFISWNGDVNKAGIHIRKLMQTQRRFMRSNRLGTIFDEYVANFVSFGGEIIGKPIHPTPHSMKNSLSLITTKGNRRNSKPSGKSKRNGSVLNYGCLS
jgi:hypothetical protein